MIQSLLELEVASGLHKRDHPVAMPTLPHHLLRSEWMEAVRAVAFRSILVVGRIGSILLKRHSQNGVGGEEGGTTGTCVRLCPIRDSGGGGPGQSLRKAATGKRGHANIEQLGVLGSGGKAAAVSWLLWSMAGACGWAIRGSHVLQCRQLRLQAPRTQSKYFPQPWHAPKP